MQTKLPIEKLGKEDIKRIAHFFVRENYGTIPSIGEPVWKNEKWKVPINANYPRILFNLRKDKPEKIRFMTFENLAILEFSEKGQIITKPKYYEVSGVIGEKLKQVKETVEKALIKVAADKFSGLTFPDHMFTPIQDILSSLLLEDTLQTEYYLGNIRDDFKREKIKHNLKILESLNLIKLDNGLILPGDPLIEIEMKNNLTNSDKLAAALTYFYQEGYDYLDAIASFLGPHLIISGYVYRESVECDELIAINIQGFKDIMAEHDKSKLNKVSRYLLQLEAIGLLMPSTRFQNSWEPNPDIFEKLKSEEDIIGPIQDMILSSAA